jgi:hypothetical protein
MKIVINKCFGGFGLSETAMFAYAARKGLTLYVERENAICVTYWTVPPEQRPAEIDWHAASLEERQAHNAAYNKAVLYGRDIHRDDADLVAVVESLGEAASDKYASLLVVEIPDGIEWGIDEYDGMESISEKHRSWG